MSGPSPSSGPSLGSSPHYHPHAMPASTNSFGSLPSWFPQSHAQSGSSSGAAYPFADSRTRIRLDAYPLFTGAEEQSEEAPLREEKEMQPRKASTSTNGSGKGAAASKGKDRDMLGTSSTKFSAGRTPKEAVPSPQSAEDKEGVDEEEGRKKGKKRRRVVVACDTCRRKKVKCEGLPNASNTCDNCQNFGYSCAFTVEPDRSRGRYEILEAQKDTILAALRIVAPDLAEQFDRGELSASSLSGVKAERGQSSQIDAAAVEMLKAEQDEHSGLKVAEEAASSHQPGEHDSFVLPREPKRDLGPMIPDLEDGRPRYFGGSSNLTSFHHLDSRPSSPGPTNRHKHLGMSTSDGPHGRESASTSLQSPAKPASSPSGSRLSVLPRPRPQYPSNSVGWVRHVRKKTLVAVGRDDLYGSEGWFQRFHFPEPQLLNELLDLFFHQLNPLLPIIHEHSFRKDLSQGRAEKDSAFRGLVFSILAIASRFLRDDPRVREDPSDPDTAGDYWAAASRFHHQVYAASLINVQMLLLTTTFMPSTLGVGTSWTVLGVAIRALQDIGLHTEKAYVEYTPLEQEMRRRAFWAAFILDCIISINMGRPTALRLADTSVKFPLLASEEALTKAEAGGPIEEQSPFDLRPCPAAGFIHLIKLNIIAQDVVNTLYSPRWKPDFISKQQTSSALHSAVAAAGQQRSHPATYKDMTILCKRLDEWVAEMPSHLQDIRTSPYKLQAGLLQCGRHDLRLYILKPFLQDGKPSFPPSDSSGAPREDGSILKKMLLPQCASHARECLKMLSLLCEEGQLSHMVFVMQQAFLSAATFMLTVWHGTKDIAVLSKDRDLIEATLSMLRPEENRYCSALLRRAQRILCNIAQRALAGMPDEAQRHRVQFLIDLHGIVTLSGDGNKLFASSNVPKDGPMPHRQNMDEGRRGSKAIVDVPPSWNKNSVRWTTNPQQQNEAPAEEKSTLRNSSTTMMTNAAMTPALAAEYPNPSIAIESKGNTPSREHNNNNHNHNDVNNVDELAAFDQWIPIESSFTSALRNEPGEIPGSFEFTSDLAWTDYFSRFLGGLPSPMAQSVSMSPMVNQTP